MNKNIVLLLLLLTVVVVVPSASARYCEIGSDGECWQPYEWNPGNDQLTGLWCSVIDPDSCYYVWDSTAVYP